MLKKMCPIEPWSNAALNTRHHSPAATSQFAWARLLISQTSASVEMKPRPKITRDTPMRKKLTGAVWNVGRAHMLLAWTT